MSELIATNKPSFHIADIVDIEELRELFETYSETTGMVTALLDLEGNVLIATNWQDSCTQFHRENEITSKRCLESDTCLAGALEKGEKYTAYQCKNGLVDVATPVIVDGEHLANFFTGQFFYEAPDLDKFSNQAEEVGFEKEAYLEAIRNVPVYDKATIEKHMKFLVRIAEIIAKMGATNLRNIRLNKELESRKQTLEKDVLARTNELEDSLKRFKLVTHGSNDGFWHWKNPEQDIVEWSDNFFTLLGYSPQEFSPSFSHFQKLLHPDDVEVTQKAVEQSIHSQTIFDIQYRIQHKSGEYTWFRGRGTPYFDESGNFIEMAGSISDISLTKQLEDKLRDTNEALEQEKFKFEQFVDLAPVGIAINNLEDGSFDFVNSEFSRFTGYEIDELNRMDYWQLTPRKYEPQEQEQLESMAETGRYGPYQKEYIHKDGHTYPVLLSGIRIKAANGKEYIWSVVQDISAQQQHEDQLKKAKQNAEKANKVKSEFLANMSHEIRTPMNGIIGLNELLLTTALNGEQKKWAIGIKESANTLLTIINDILDISKIESGKLEIESTSFDLRELIQQVESPCAVSAHNKSLEFSTTCSNLFTSRFLGDPVRIKQVLLNLVNNAIKFTDSGSVSLKVTTKEKIDDEKLILKFEVTDTGIGLNTKQQAKLFDRFSQADSSTTRRFGGTGLGLNISMQLVELMGGEIGVNSEEGQGSTFWFTLPLSIASESNHQSVPSDTGQQTISADHERKIRALLVEDNRINQLVAENVLQTLGIESDLAENGKQAIDLLSSQQYDIVFMDCHMPVMDGFEATQKIRSDDRFKELPIVALTAGAMEDEHKQCIASGMNSVITKPFEPEDIVRAIKSFVSNK